MYFPAGFSSQVNFTGPEEEAVCETSSAASLGTGDEKTLIQLLFKLHFIHEYCIFLVIPLLSLKTPLPGGTTKYTSDARKLQELTGKFWNYWKTLGIDKDLENDFEIKTDARI